MYIFLSANKGARHDGSKWKLKVIVVSAALQRCKWLRFSDWKQPCRWVAGRHLGDKKSTNRLIPGRTAPLRRNQHIVTYFGNIHSKLKQHLSEVCHLYQDFAQSLIIFPFQFHVFFHGFFHTYHVGEAFRLLGFPWVDVDGNFTICLEISIPGGSVWIWKKT